MRFHCDFCHEATGISDFGNVNVRQALCLSGYLFNIKYRGENEMKKRIIIVISLVAVLVLGTVFVAQAGADRKIQGMMKAEYYGGYNWMVLNVHVSPSGEVTGDMAHYRSYRETPNEWNYWRSETLCVTFGEYDGKPAAVSVGRFVESTNWPVGYYSKGIFVDGGPNAKNDLVGLIVWPPVPDPPNCDFEEPFYAWPGVAGNITIH
jgi:hypothetical protein